jgi:hypothetical protein
MKNLVIAVIGNRNSGKSTTWYELFGRTVRTGSELKKLYLTSTEYTEVFLVSGSPEERETYVGDIIGNQRPRIVLCSMQYRQDVTTTIDFFIQNEYFIFAHWLNPGFNDDNTKSFDNLGLTNYLIANDSMVGIRNGKGNPKIRVQEIKDYLYGWAKSRNLVLV